MKNFYILLILLGVISLNVFAQKNTGVTPPSFNYQLTTDIDHVMLPAPDVQALLEEDAANDEKGVAYRFGKILQTNLTPLNSGTWTDLPNGGRIWRLKIESKSALALGLYYNSFNLPLGAKLFVYNDEKSEVVGKLDHYSNEKGEEFATDFTEGDVTIIEYYEPGKVTSNFDLQISGVSYVYKDVPFVSMKQKGGSGSCEVNIQCPEGDNWQDEKKGVAVISIVIGTGNYVCSGSLVNNTNQDCTPYFLSAQHCGDGASASDFNQWVFYFGYEASTCGGSTAGYQELKTGATKRAEADNNAGTNSDMLLLELNQSTFTNYVPYLNGWSRSTTASPSGVCIHHPAGDIKKISTYTSSLTNYYNTHWMVYWAATVTDHGVTEGGSSGSPIFNNNSLIVGTLTGGTSYCTAPNDPDIYGKFSYHWDQNGTSNAERLRPWLDPAGTNPTTQAGIYYPCSGGGVTANFTGSPTTVIEGNSVSFTDQSSGSITSWNWSFPGGTPSSYSGQNPPAITYNTQGTYNVSLTVSDGSSNDTELKSGYITVVPQGSGGCDTLRYPLAGTPSLYGALPGGYMSGNNAYGDLAKVDYFDNYAPYSQIDGAMIAFGAASGSGTCRVAVWNESGGTPGTMIGYKDVNISTILTDIGNGSYTSVTFSTPITIPGNFFLGVILPTTAGDTVAIITNDDGESNPNTAWEQWDDNSWYAYDDGDSWEKSMSHAISPIVCTGSTGFMSINDTDFEIFPNPAKDQITVNAPVNKYSVVVYDMTGEVVMNIESVNNEKILDISHLNNGIYHFVIQTNDRQITKKISVIR